VGRVLKRRGLINLKISTKRRKAALRPKVRFPRGLRISEAGDVIQTDAKHTMLSGGKKFYQFTAIDVLGKKKAMRVYPSESHPETELNLLKNACWDFLSLSRQSRRTMAPPFRKSLI
jgi:hypothetical protein